MVKSTDFSDINSDRLLREAAEFGWHVGGIEILVNELKANISTKTVTG